MHDEGTVVAADPEHHGDFVRLSAQLGSHDPIPPVERWMAEMASDSFFLELGGRAVAYGYGHVLEKSGYVRHVVVEREHRGRGLGRRLMREHARRFRAAGCERWQLNVLRGNAVAIALYRALGMEVEHSTWVVRIAPRDVERLPSSTRRVEMRALDASRDAEAERAFELPPALLATLRGRHGQRIVELVDASQPDSPSLAVARFNPDYPGCFPFRVADPSLARAFIEPMLEALPSDAPWIQFVIERDETLAKTLLAAGATLEHDIVHMQGPLPSGAP